MVGMHSDEKNSPLDRYIAVLEAIAAAPVPPGLSELAASCGLPLGSAHRLSNGLLASKLALANGTTRKTYQLGPRLLRLLHSGSLADKVSVVAQETLEALANQIGETCYLARLSGEQVVSVAWAVPDRGVRGYVYPGDVMPPNAAASAKAIMAFQTPEFIERVLTRPLERLTTSTKLDPREIRAEYAEVRRLGYATCWDEIEIGLGAIACPVHIEEIGILYALGTSGIAKRLQCRNIEAVVADLRTALPKLKRMLRHISESTATSTRPMPTRGPAAKRT